MWSYRRFIAAANFDDPALPCDLSMINTFSNDYQGGTIPTGDPAADLAVMQAARQAALGYVFWLQTECPRDDDPARLGFPTQAPRRSVRHGRRRRRGAVHPGVAAHSGPADDRAAGPRHGVQPRAARQAVPRRVRHRPVRGHGRARARGGRHAGVVCHHQAVSNPAGRADPDPRRQHPRGIQESRGDTHHQRCLPPASGRMEHRRVRGALAAYCVQHTLTPRAVWSSPTLLRQYQHTLLNAGVPLFWWTDVTFDNKDLFVAAHLLGVAGILGGTDDMNLRPNDVLTDQARQDIQGTVGTPLAWPAGQLLQGQAALWLAQTLGLLSPADRGGTPQRRCSAGTRSAACCPPDSARRPQHPARTTRPAAGARRRSARLDGGDILVDAGAPAGSEQRHDIVAALQQPRERHLTRGGALAAKARRASASARLRRKLSP